MANHFLNNGGFHVAQERRRQSPLPNLNDRPSSSGLSQTPNPNPLGLRIVEDGTAHALRPFQRFGFRCPWSTASTKIEFASIRN